MDLNNFIFPYPTSNYTARKFKNLIWIKRGKISDKIITKTKKTDKGTIKGVLRPSKLIGN